MSSSLDANCFDRHLSLVLSFRCLELLATDDWCDWTKCYSWGDIKADNKKVIKGLFLFPLSAGPFRESLSQQPSAFAASLHQWNFSFSFFLLPDSSKFHILHPIYPLSLLRTYPNHPSFIFLTFSPKYSTTLSHIVMVRLINFIPV